MRADALYCLVMGAAAASLAEHAAVRLGLPPKVVRRAGVATVGWAGIVGVSSFVGSWRGATRAVSMANFGAAAGLAGLALARSGRPGRVGMLITAGDVAAFGVHQTLVLRRLDPSAVTDLVAADQSPS